MAHSIECHAVRAACAPVEFFVAADNSDRWEKERDTDFPLHRFPLSSLTSSLSLSIYLSLSFSSSSFSSSRGFPRSSFPAIELGRKRGGMRGETRKANLSASRLRRCANKQRNLSSRSRKEQILTVAADLNPLYNAPEYFTGSAEVREAESGNYFSRGVDAFLKRRRK